MSIALVLWQIISFLIGVGVFVGIGWVCESSWWGLVLLGVVGGVIGWVVFWIVLIVGLSKGG